MVQKLNILQELPAPATGYNSLIIGHVTNDINVDFTGEVQEMHGGAVLYSSASAHSLGFNVLAVTKVAKADESSVADAFYLPKSNLTIRNSAHTTDFKNVYLDPKREVRESTVQSIGDPFNLDDVKSTPIFDQDGNLQVGLFHFAGLLVGDFSDELMIGCSKLAPIAVDAQALVRWSVDHEIIFRDYVSKSTLFPHLTFLKTDEREAAILTGQTDRKTAAKAMFDLGAPEIMITNSDEVLIYNGSEFFNVPIRSKNLSGRTGRGDTTFAAYINQRQYSGIGESLLLATATVSLKMEIPGPLRSTRQAIIDYLAATYPEYIM
jgi:sugar/nucleoside kinase (ribokinase family)